MPIGGERVPTSMPSEFPETREDEKEFRPNDEYESVMNLRNTLGDFKKELMLVCP